MEEQQEPDINKVVSDISPKKSHKIIKYIVMGIFIFLPFVGFYLGMEYQKQQSISVQTQITNKQDTVSPTIIAAPTNTIEDFSEDTSNNSESKDSTIVDSHKSAQYELYSISSDWPTYYPNGEESGSLVIKEDLLVKDLKTGDENTYNVYETFVPQEILTFLETVPPEVNHYLSLKLLDWEPASEAVFWGEISIYGPGDPPVPNEVSLFRIDLTDSTVNTFVVPNHKGLFKEPNTNIAAKKVIYEIYGDDSLSLYMYDLETKEEKLIVTYSKEVFDQHCNGFIDYYSSYGNCYKERSLQPTWEGEGFSYLDFVTREKVAI